MIVESMEFRESSNVIEAMKLINNIPGSWFKCTKTRFDKFILEFDIKGDVRALKQIKQLLS